MKEWLWLHQFKAVPAAAAAKLLQSCPTLCDTIDSSSPGSSIPGILQARTLEWVTISFSNAWKWKVKVKLLSRVRLLATPWTAVYQAPWSMEFSRQENWSGLPLPFPSRKSTWNKNVGMFKITGRNGLYISQLGDSIIYHPKWNLFKSERGQPNRKPGKQE